VILVDSFIIVGTAGHVDHGKTELVKALTGIDTDRLKEEKERGISIELGFEPLRFSGGVTAGIVDVPGHERFVKNMLAGAGGCVVLTALFFFALFYALKQLLTYFKRRNALQENKR
jgi:selenocysteine-specific elongation factor